jgi:hypothetical protein
MEGGTVTSKISLDNGSSKIRHQRVALVLAVALCLVAVLGGVAQADHWPLCSGSTGWFCVYKNTGGHDGGVQTFTGNDRNYSGDNFDRCFVNCDVNDATSSLWNREGFRVRSFVHSGFGGQCFGTGAGVKRTSVPSGFNDALSSHSSSATCT